MPKILVLGETGQLAQSLAGLRWPAGFDLAFIGRRHLPDGAPAAGVRAALCNDLYTARLAREHNDANVLSLGGRIVAAGLADEIVAVWLATAFAGGRHLRRVEQISAAERRG